MNIKPLIADKTIVNKPYGVMVQSASQTTAKTVQDRIIRDVYRSGITTDNSAKVRTFDGIHQFLQHRIFPSMSLK